MCDVTSTGAAEAAAVLVNPLPSSLSSSLRAGTWPLTNPLLYSFSFEYRAWIEVVPLHFHSRGPMVLAREVLLRALFELELVTKPAPDQAELFPGQAIEKATREAKRRGRAWMTVNGIRYLGAGADSNNYRSVVVRVGEQFVAAVVPVSQKHITVQVAGLQADVEQRRAVGDASRAEVTAA